MTEPDWLQLLEVAEHYRTTEATVRYWRQHGYGPKGVKLGTRVLYPRAEIERYDRELQQRAAAQTERTASPAELADEDAKIARANAAAPKRNRYPDAAA